MNENNDNAQPAAQAKVPAAPKACAWGCHRSGGCYTASTGETWHVFEGDWRGEWEAVPDNFEGDGASHVEATSREKAIAAVEELIEEEAHDAEAAEVERRLTDRRPDDWKEHAERWPATAEGVR